MAKNEWDLDEKEVMARGSTHSRRKRRSDNRFAIIALVILFVLAICFVLAVYEPFWPNDWWPKSRRNEPVERMLQVQPDPAPATQSPQRYVSPPASRTQSDTKRDTNPFD